MHSNKLTKAAEIIKQAYSARLPLHGYEPRGGGVEGKSYQRMNACHTLRYLIYMMNYSRVNINIHVREVEADWRER